MAIFFVKSQKSLYWIRQPLLLLGRQVAKIRQKKKKKH
jgi:hypothetical protein